MADPHSKDPLHGVTLEKILLHLEEEYGWEELGRRVPIRCFRLNPSLNSCLQFLRRTPWARTQVENLYLHSLPKDPERSPFHRRESHD